MYGIAFVLRGKLRKIILESLEKPKTAKTVSKEINKHLQSVSRSIIQLKKEGLVKCLNPKDDRFRFYQITPKGKEVLRKAKEIG